MTSHRMIPAAMLLVLAQSLVAGASPGGSSATFSLQAPSNLVVRLAQPKAASEPGASLHCELQPIWGTTNTVRLSPVPLTNAAATALPLPPLHAPAVFRARLLTPGGASQPEAVDAATPFTVGSASASPGTSNAVWSAGRPAIARVCAILQSGMVIGPLCPWILTSGSEIRTPWDFRDPQGAVDYRFHPDLRLITQVQPLPSDWIITGTPLFTDVAPAVPDLAGLRLPNQPLGCTVDRTPGSDAFRMTLDPKTRAFFASRRFEILLFLNGEFFHEESNGFDPFRFKLPHQQALRGNNILTLNLLDYEGNIGSYSLPVALP